MNAYSIQRMAAAVALGIATIGAPARADSGGDVKQQLQRTVDALAADWAGHDAHAIATKYFTGDVTMIGEGGAAMTTGAAQLEPALKHLFELARTARLEVYAAKVLGPDAAYAWVVWHCNPEQDAKAQFKVRSLYVFRREAGQWKVAADAYSMGGITR